MAIVQEPDQAKYDGIPMSAIETGLVDQTLTVEATPRELLNYVNSRYLEVPEKHEKADGSPFTGYLQKISPLIRTVTGRDFTQYKQSTIRRRIKRRMALHKIEDIRDYHSTCRKTMPKCIGSSKNCSFW